jgi:hypothetical protein
VVATVKVEVTEVVGGLKRATSVVGGVGRVPLVDLTGEGASAPPAFGARRAGALPLAAQEVRAVAAHHEEVVEALAGVEVPPVVAVAAAVVVVAVVVVADEG